MIDVRLGELPLDLKSIPLHVLFEGWIGHSLASRPVVLSLLFRLIDGSDLSIGLPLLLFLSPPFLLLRVTFDLDVV